MDMEKMVIKNMLELLKHMLFGNQCRAERSFVSQAGSIVYICALRQFDPASFAHKINSMPEAKCFVLHAEHLKGIYVEFANCWMLIYCPNESKITLSPDSFNQSIDSVGTQELVSFGNTHNIKNLTAIGFDVFVAMYETYYEIIKQVFNLNEDQLCRIKLINTFKEFLNNYKQLSSGKMISTRAHVGSFSSIYYVEIQAIKMLIGDMQGIHIHDVATNTGNLPMLFGQLAQEDILPFNVSTICCSDYNDSIPSNNIAIIEDALGEFKIPIHVKRLDLRAPDSSLYEADVIIANDILEHFYDEESQQILNNLWKYTKNVLIIHVPIEETANRFFGHFTNFTNEKLELWASKLPECENLTQQVLDLADLDSHNTDGFLFLKNKKLL